MTPKNIVDRTNDPKSHRLTEVAQQILIGLQDVYPYRFVLIVRDGIDVGSGAVGYASDDEIADELEGCYTAFTVARGLQS